MNICDPEYYAFKLRCEQLFEFKRDGLQHIPDLAEINANHAKWTGYARWIRLRDDMPPQGIVVPVWDGDYMYYASYWEKNGTQFWIITESISPQKGETDLLKQAGEEVYPIHWMRLLPPMKS